MYKLIIIDEVFNEFKSPTLSFNDAIDYYSDAIKMLIRFDITNYSIELWELKDNGENKRILEQYINIARE